MDVVFILFLHSNIHWFGKLSPNALIPSIVVQLLKCVSAVGESFVNSPPLEFLIIDYYISHKDIANNVCCSVFKNKEQRKLSNGYFVKRRGRS